MFLMQRDQSVVLDCEGLVVFRCLGQEKEDVIDLCKPTILDHALYFPRLKF